MLTTTLTLPLLLQKTRVPERRKQNQEGNANINIVMGDLAFVLSHKRDRLAAVWNHAQQHYDTGTHFPLPLLPRTPTTFIGLPPNPLYSITDEQQQERSNRRGRREGRLGWLTEQID